MTLIHAIEDNALAYYKGMARYLGGEYIEQEQATWFTTGRRSQFRFNGVLHTAVSPAEGLHKMADPILAVFLAQNLPFFWVDWPAVGTPGLGRYLISKGLESDAQSSCHVARAGGSAARLSSARSRT